jgi:hypothetical protein
MAPRKCSYRVLVYDDRGLPHLIATDVRRSINKVTLHRRVHPFSTSVGIAKTLKCQLIAKIKKKPVEKTGDELEYERISQLTTRQLLDYVLEHPSYLTDSYYRGFDSAIYSRAGALLSECTPNKKEES